MLIYLEFTASPVVILPHLRTICCNFGPANFVTMAVGEVQWPYVHSRVSL
jgi:hypothetical protein